MNYRHFAVTVRSRNRLVTQAIIPERASKHAARGDAREAAAAMLNEWNAFKKKWAK